MLSPQDEPDHDIRLEQAHNGCLDSQLDAQAQFSGNRVGSEEQLPW